jgi:O-antigen/teichoic acid export membrane protein
MKQLVKRLMQGRQRLMGSFWSVVEYAWYPVLLLVTTPFFLDRLGTEAFGQWALLSATIGFGAFLNIGTGAATVRAIAHGIAARDRDDVELLVRGSLAIALAGGLLLALAIFATFLVGSGTFLMRMGARDAVLLTGATAAAIALIEQVENVFTSTLRGGERFRTIATIEMWMRSLQIGAAVTAVAVFGTLAALYAALVLTACARLAVRVIVVERWLHLKSLRPSLAEHHAILRDAGWGWLQGVGGLAFGVADRFIIGSAVGAAGLAHYAVATQLAQPLHAFAAAAASVVFPKVGRAMAQGDPARVQRLIVRGVLLLGAATTSIALVLLVFRVEILTLWLGADVAAAAAPTLGLLLIAYWLLSLGVLPHFILLGLGRMRFVALSNLFAGALTLVAMLLLVGPLGIVGIAMARIIYGIALLINYEPLRRFWKTHAQTV